MKGIERQNIIKYKDVSLNKMTKRQTIGVWFLAFGGVLIVQAIPIGNDHTSLWLKLVISIPCVVLMVVFHEALHGLFLWVYSGKVKFGVLWKTKFGVCPYATSPKSIFTKKEMLMIILAPQIMTVILLLCMFLIKAPFLVTYGWQTMAAMNLGGGCLDIYYAQLLLAERGEFYIEDTMGGAIWYRKIENT